MENTQKFNYLDNNQNILPPCKLYSTYLGMAKEKLSISLEEARSKYGTFTIEQWEKLLKSETI